MHRGKIEIGIVGTGWIATNAHIPVLKKNEKVVVKAAYDTCFERAKEVCSNFRIPNVFQEFQPFLECGLDGVIIATPNYTHICYTKEALKNKISVLCEKPIAFKADELKEIRKLAEDNDVVYIPGFVNRWRKDIQTLYKIIRENQLGDIEQVDGGWIRKFGVPRPGTWFTNRSYSGGGVLEDLGSHVVDICSLLLDSEALPADYQLITALCTEKKILNSGSATWFQRNDAKKFEVNVEDTAIARINYSNHKTLNANLSWLAPVKADCTYFKVKGTKGEAVLKTLFGFSNERLWDKDTLEYEINGSKKAIEFHPNENHSRYAFSEMLSYYIDTMLQGKSGFSEYHNAYMTVALIDNLYQNEVVDEEKCYQIVTEGI